MIVVDMRRDVASLPNATNRFAMVRDLSIVFLALRTTKRGFELSEAVAAQDLHISGGEGFIFNFLFEETLRKPSQEVVVRIDADYRQICALVTLVEYRQDSGSM